MNEMHDLYDIINALRIKHSLSSRQLALRAKIPPTTLASMMARRPSTIDRGFLTRIANVFGIKWYELLNKTRHFAEECGWDKRISTSMSPEDIQAVKEKFLNSFSFTFDFLNPERTAACAEESHIRDANGSDFKRSFLFVLDRLNDDGLIEAMRRVLDIAQEPKFCASYQPNDMEADTGRKEQ